MLQVILNQRRQQFDEGTTILAACGQLGIELPTLCHDDRLQPAGACRLCVVEIKGWNRFATACNTTLADGMEIETHSAAVEEARRELLRLLREDYPAAAITAAPEKPFHRWLIHYGLAGSSPAAPGAVPHARFRDASHPYIHVDMDRCITCFRCVRICDEVQGQFVWRAWGRGDATTIRPGAASTLLDSACVSCGACVDTCPTGALEDQSVIAEGEPRDWTRTTCPYCGTGCEMWVGTRDERIVQVRPVMEAPVNKGHLCVKGRYAFAYNHSPDRVLEPMIRGADGWRRVSWAEAIEAVARGFQRLIEESGPDCLGVLGSARGTNEENYLAQKFARVVLRTNNVDCCARVCHAPTAAGMKLTFGTGAATNGFDDIEKAASFLICGCNPTENHPIVGARIKQAVRRGARLIVVDPRVIELARGADLHLQVRPGTNVPLLNALAHVILAEDLADPVALRDRVSGLEPFRDCVARWTPERASTITGVLAGTIRAAARLYATTSPAMCFHGLGMTEHLQGTEGVMALANLALLTGNFGKAGSGINPLRGQNNVQGAAHMGCEPGHLTGYVPLAAGQDTFAEAWRMPLPQRPGLNMMEMMDAAGRKALRGLWVIGYDVALTNPNTAATRTALRALDFIVVQDLFLNELAREFGHVFLPACSSFEKDGTFMNSERRVQRVRAALLPPGQSRADWEIVCDVAKAMGAEDGFNFAGPVEIWDEVRRVWAAGAGLSYGRLEQGGLAWPCPAEDHPGTAVLHTDRFSHASRASLQLVDYIASAEEVSAEFPFLLTTGRTLYPFNAGTMTGRTANAQLRPADTLDLAPGDAARLGLGNGDMVRVRSRHGEAVMPVRLEPGLRSGEFFATFHTAEVLLNQITGPARDRRVMTPEYKVTAVNLSPETMSARQLP